MFIFLCSQFSHSRLFGIKHISFPSDFKPYGNLISELHLSELDTYLLNAKLGVNVLHCLKYQVHNLILQMPWFPGFKVGFIRNSEKWATYPNRTAKLFSPSSRALFLCWTPGSAGYLFSWRSLSNSISWARLKNSHQIILWLYIELPPYTSIHVYEYINIHIGQLLKLSILESPCFSHYTTFER